MQGGRWYGTAIVIGKVGRNYVVIHRKQIFRCAPEQLRYATSEEQAVSTTPEAELLGIRDLIEQNQLKSKQYVDLVPSSYPPTADDTPMPDAVAARSQESVDGDKSTLPDVPPYVPDNTKSSEMPGSSNKFDEMHGPQPADGSLLPGSPDDEGAASSSSYGPFRRVRGKSHEAALSRPPLMKEDDFADMMREVLPQLIEDTLQQQSDGPQAMDSQAPAEPNKRPLDEPEMPPGHKARSSDYDEHLSVEDVSQCWNSEQAVESLIATYMSQKMSKEVPPSGNSSSLQAAVDESKTLEWDTLIEKGAIKVHYGKHAQYLREKFSHRFMGSRFVIVRKPIHRRV